MNRLLVNPQTAMGGALIDSIRHLVSARQEITRLNAAIGMMRYGDPADDQQAATELGIDVSKVADLASILTALEAAINAPIVSEAIARCDQG